MIEVTQRGEVAVLQLKHGKANALDVEFCDAIAAQLQALKNSSAGALVLIGQGQIFSAGVDLRRVLSGGPVYIRAFIPSLQKAFEILFNFPKPVVAAVNGHAIAGGCILACAADHRIMANGSGRIGTPELLVGVPFPTVALETVRFAAGPQHFQKLVYSGATLSPHKAQEYGLVDEVADPGALLDHAVAAAERLARLPRAAFALTKSQIRQPTRTRIQNDGPRFDPTVEESWSSPETLAAIQQYVDRTLKKPS
ncbi:MAG: enoyl-CoA hydratase/isomerase family protein [Acidobacteriia bacterium]|nr:enoyl-CoA hydratase/isomerase family protein [Terriglobia bacterium]